jgi:acyl carrier protein
MALLSRNFNMLALENSMEEISLNKNVNTNLSEEYRAAIQTILMEQLAIPRTQITPDARIVEDLNADSLDKIEITMMLEERFALAIPDAKVEKIQTVADIYDVVARFAGTSQDKN